MLEDRRKVALFALPEGEVTMRIICAYEDYERWKDGKTVYLARARCFATFNMAYFSKEEEEQVMPEKQPSMEQARYAYARSQYEKLKPDATPFDMLADEERQEFYFENVIERYSPIMYHEWLDTGNVADILEFHTPGIDKRFVAFTLDPNVLRRKVKESENGR